MEGNSLYSTIFPDILFKKRTMKLNPSLAAIVLRILEDTVLDIM
jgi:hypothetical protein